MSALPPKADIGTQSRDVRHSALRQKTLLFDHLIGAGEQCWGNVKADCLGGFQVNDEIELGSLLDREVARFFALEDAAGIDAGLAIRIEEARPVAHQPAGRREIANGVDRRQFLVYRKRGQLYGILQE